MKTWQVVAVAVIATIAVQKVMKSGMNPLPAGVKSFLTI